MRVCSAPDYRDTGRQSQLRRRRPLQSPDNVRSVNKVRQLREGGLKAYYSMQTGPSVFINTNEKDQKAVLRAVEKLGYRAYLSSVGGEATLL